MKKLIIILSTFICFTIAGCQPFQNDNLESKNIVKLGFFSNNGKLKKINQQIEIATVALQSIPNEKQLEAIDSEAYGYLKLIAKAKLNRYRLQKNHATSSEIEEKTQEITQLKAKLKLVQSPLTNTIEKSQNIKNFITTNNLPDSIEKETLLKQYNQLRAKADIAEQKLNKFSRQTDYTEIKKAQVKIEAAEADCIREVSEIKIEAANRVINGTMGRIVADTWSKQQILAAQQEKVAKYNESLAEQREFFKYKLAPRTKASLEAILESDDLSSVSYEEILMAQVEISEMEDVSIDIDPLK